MIRVGVAQRGYGPDAAFGAVDVEGVEFTRERLLPLNNRLTAQIPRVSTAVYAIGCVAPGGPSDLLHSYNKLLLNRKPWIVSFESRLPRSWFRRPIQRAVFGLAARDACRAVLPLSKNALSIMIRRNDGHPALSSVVDKARVVYPAVRDMPQHYAARRAAGCDGPLRLLFVGRQFFQKGGHLAVKAFERLEPRVALTVVSSMDPYDYLIPRGAGEPDAWRARMRACGVRHFESLPNDDVRGLMAAADVLLLPTLDDTFGLSMIEGMATGLVPVATSIRALPEIVEHGESGFLIEVATNEEGRIDLARSGEREIEQGLVEILSRLAEDRGTVDRVGEAARRRYLAQFSQVRLAEELAEVYARAAL